MKKVNALFLVTLMICSSNKTYCKVDVFGKIMQRIKTNLQKEISSAKRLDLNITKELKILSQDGSWSDIDYNQTNRVHWSPANHIRRVKIFALSYTYKKSKYYGKQKLYKAITRTLRLWYHKNPKCNNWWNNKIGIPQKLGEIMIIMRFGKELLPSSLQDSLIRIMKRGDPRSYTGANKQDIALHCLYRACLIRDSVLLDFAVKQTFQPIALVRDKEGLQVDYSYLQHGRQLQISSYGSVFLTDAFTIAAYVRGTNYALSKSKLRRLSEFYRKTYLKTIRGGYIDFNVEGRGISRRSILNKKGEERRLKKAILVDSTHCSFYLKTIARISGVKPSSFGVFPFHKYFWCGDYTIHVRPGYSFNVRTVSSRTKRTEMGNKENILGRYLPDGSTDIQRTGYEYYNIMPVWEWDKIPGITSRDYERDRSRTVNWGQKGSTSFVGGVSDNKYGVSEYKLDYDSVQAFKSWFFFDKAIVCLGVGINSLTSQNIVTTINQCWLAGLIYIAKDGKVKPMQANSLIKIINPDWVWQDSIGYFFPKGGNINVSNKTQKGTWHRINKSYPLKTVKGSVFKMWIDHGSHPNNKKYSYIVVPDIKNWRRLKKFPYSNFEILDNSDSLQAVWNKNLNILQMIFYRPGRYSDSNFFISVDKPCVLMLTDIESKKPRISISDPAQLYKSIKIIFKLPGMKNVKKELFHFPRYPFSGKTLSLQVKK